MTDQEKTELAMKAAQQGNKGLEEYRKELEASKAPKETSAPAPKETKEKAKKEPKANPNLIELGGDRKATISPWKGSTIKKFKKVFEYVDDIEDVDFVRLMDVLVYDHIKEDLLLVDNEIQYLLAKLCEISLQEEYKVEVTCPKCQAKNTVTGLISEAVYTPTKLPGEWKDVKFVSAKKSVTDEATAKIIEADDYDGLTSATDVQTACMMKYKSNTPKQMIKYLDELPLKELKELMKAFEDILPDYKHIKHSECRNCQKDVDFEVNILTSVFEGLMT